MYVNVQLGGVVMTAQCRCVNKSASIMEIAPCLIFVRVKEVGQVLTAQYPFVHRIATMVVSVLHLILVNAYNGKICGGTVGLMVEFLCIKSQMETHK